MEIPRQQAHGGPRTSDDSVRDESVRRPGSDGVSVGGKHRAQLPQVHSLLEAAFHALDQSGAPWMLLRGEKDLGRPVGDVDVLVAGPAVDSVLDDLLDRVGFRRIVASGHGEHRFYFAYDGHWGMWLKLDIVGALSFGGLQQWETPLAEVCLNRRRRVGPVFLPAPDDQAWLYLLHLLLDKGEISRSRAVAVAEATSRACPGGPVSDWIDSQFGVGRAQALVETLKAGRFDDVPSVAAAMSARLSTRSPLRSRAIAMKHRVLRRIATPTLAHRAGRGLKVAVMGPDGAGKTTLLNGIGSDFPVPSKYVYMGMWQASRSDWVARRIPGGRVVQKMFRLIRGGAISAYHRSRGRLVLLDRVAYDALLPGSIDSSIGGKVISTLALRLAPKPDLLFVLDAPGELMFARKAEHSVETLESWRLAYLRLAESIPDSVVIDATESASEVRRRATDLVWRRLSTLVPAGDNNLLGTQEPAA